jgi:hypothetical protein
VTTYTLIVTFEIDWEDDKSYNAIYTALGQAVTHNLNPTDCWCETTSFFIISTSETSKVFAERVWKTAKMREDKDRLVVLNIVAKTGYALGKIEDNDLFTLLPFVKKL